jgi:hypothetical protein
VAPAERATSAGKPSSLQASRTQLSTSTPQPSLPPLLERGEEVEVVIRYRGQEWSIKGDVTFVNLSNDVAQMPSYYDGPYLAYGLTGDSILNIGLNRRRQLLRGSSIEVAPQEGRT